MDSAQPIPNQAQSTLAQAALFEGLIFDCDGTLADTMPLHYVAWQDTLSRNSLEFGEDTFYAMAGQPTVYIIEQLLRDQGVTGDAMAIAKEKEQEFLKVLDQVKPIEPIVDLARQWHGKKPMAVGSGSNHDVVLKIVDLIGLGDVFSVVVGAEQTENPKPAPDVFLTAAKGIGVAPESCCVFEDADLGIQAAKSGGMAWFDIRQIHTPKRMT